MRALEFDQARLGKHAPDLCFEVAPLLRAIEVFEYREATFQEPGTKGLGLSIGEMPEAGLPHERDRVLEQLRIVEREDPAAVGVDIDRGELVHDEREVALRSGNIVIPGRVEAPAGEAEVRFPAEPHERHSAVVREIGPKRSLERAELR